MKIAITDANIFIDLIYIELHHALFAAELEIYTTLNVIEELNDDQQELLADYISNGKLTLHAWEENALPSAIQANQNLSVSDKSVFSLAHHLGACILTGDGLLRKISGFQNIEVHGILWLLDRFLDMKLVAKSHAVTQLERLMKYNKRLPGDDCAERISRWNQRE